MPFCFYFFFQKAWHFMWIVCWQVIYMKYQALFSLKKVHPAKKEKKKNNKKKKKKKKKKTNHKSQQKSSKSKIKQTNKQNNSNRNNNNNNNKSKTKQRSWAHKIIRRQTDHALLTLSRKKNVQYFRGFSSLGILLRECQTLLPEKKTFQNKKGIACKGINL